MSNNLDITQKVAFDHIRYANVWEDADILLKGLGNMENKRILSIASAGDNAFSLLTLNPELVVAFDINPIQLYLVELKKAAIEELEYDEVLKFLGFKEDLSRIVSFKKLEHKLSSPCLEYWNDNFELIDKGVIHQGKFEKYFQFFSKKVLPFIHSKKKVNQLFSKKSAEEQSTFYKKSWNTWRWRLLFRIFFSKTVMGKKGRDPQFLKHVKVNVGEFIFNRAAQHLSSQGAQSNYILHYNLKGHYGELLPHYLKPQNFELIKTACHKLQIFQGFPLDAIQQHGPFDGMNLSDIFEYMDDQTFLKNAEELIAGCNDNARIAYWNLMVDRHIGSILPNKCSYRKELSEELTAKDKGFFYKGFYIDEVKK